jgi:hypothetical protein
MSYEGLRCVICNQLVNLRSSKADENGQAVHEDCYVSVLVKRDDRAGHSHPSRFQIGQGLPFPMHYSDDLSRGTPMTPPVNGGFWY